MRTSAKQIGIPISLRWLPRPSTKLEQHTRSPIGFGGILQGYKGEVIAWRLRLFIANGDPKHLGNL